MTGLMTVIGSLNPHRNGHRMSDVTVTGSRFAGKERCLMKRYSFVMCIILIVTISMPALAHCSLDHLIIGCNEDGLKGTDDDRKLFVDCGQKYRNISPTTYRNWYYPLHKSIFPEYSYRLGEPGFDVFQNQHLHESHTYDPNRCLIGRPDEDYRIIVECIIWTYCTEGTMNRFI